jgi:hypothetical protein
MKSLSWINFLLGLWLLTAAVAFSTGGGRMLAGESIAGVVIMVLAYASAVGRPQEGVSWGVACAGLWALIVNYAVHTDPRSHAVLVGCLVVVLGTVNAVYRHVRVTA